MIRKATRLVLVVVFSFGWVSGAGAQPPQAPASYVESIETRGELGGEEDVFDSEEAQAERYETTGDAPADRHTLRTVEEIVVSARKRDEFLEDTPVSVTALSETTLMEAGIQRLDEIQTLVPNLQFQSDNTGGQSNIRIRGVGTSATAISFDPGVGVYIDGVFLPRGFGTLVDIVDVQQIEVLRGPQGTLFGKNTVGGAINITTIKPRDQFEGFAMVRPSNFGRVDTRFMINVPILEDTLFTRFSFATTNTPGFTYNAVRDEPLNGKNSVAVLGSFRWLPHQDLTLDFTGTWSRDSNNGIAQQCVVVREDVPLRTFLSDAYFENCADTTPFVTNANVATLTDIESYGTWLTADWDVGEVPFFGDVSVKSLTSWREQKPRVRFDVDQTRYDIVQLSSAGGSIRDGDPGFQRQIMQEGQLNGAALEGDLNYVAGVFGFWETGFDNRATYVLPPGQPGDPPPPALNRLTDAPIDIDNWTWALYGQATYDVLDWMSLTGGIRYTQDKKGLLFQQFDPRTGEQFANESGDKVFDAWTPMGSIALTLPEDLMDDIPLDHLMGYFTYARGFKGGGFNGVATGRSGAGAGDAFAYDPETLDNFEIGFKLIGFDQLATLNTSFFYGKYDDIQVTSVRDTGLDENGVPTIARLTTNAAEATTKGFEIELNTRPVEGLMIVGNVGYTDAVYDSFPDAVSDYDGETIDRSGDPFLFVPKLGSFVSVQYSMEMGWLEDTPMRGWITPRLEWAYTSETQWLGPEVPQATQRGFNLLNARLSYDFYDNRAQVALWGKNLTDEAYFTYATAIVSTFGIATRGFQAPRTFGGELSYRF